jgi:hypothetical protein
MNINELIDDMRVELDERRSYALTNTNVAQLLEAIDSARAQRNHWKLECERADKKWKELEAEVGRLIKKEEKTVMELRFHLDQGQYGPSIKPMAGSDGSRFFYAGLIFEDNPLTVEVHGELDALLVLFGGLLEMLQDYKKSVVKHSTKAIHLVRDVDETKEL